LWTRCPIGLEIGAVGDDPDIVNYATDAVAIGDLASAIDKNATLVNDLGTARQINHHEMQ
jgi:hypothetical protein